MADSAAVATPRPPNMEHIVKLNRGPFVGSVPALGPTDPRRPLRARRTRPRRRTSPATSREQSTCPCPLLLRNEGGLPHSPEWDSRAPRRVAAAVRARRREAPRRGFPRARGFIPGPGGARDARAHRPRRAGTAGRGQLGGGDRRAGAVRTRCRLHPRQPQHPLPRHRRLRRRLRGGRPLVTICESGARAGIAASVLAAGGIKSRPVLHGGVDDWQRRGNQTVEFRRCGS